MDNIDKLTLECFVNRNIYRKYLAKYDPVSFEATQIQREQNQQLKTQILAWISDYIDSPDTDQRDLQQACDVFLQLLKNHIVQSEYVEDEWEEPMLIATPEPTNMIEYWKKQKVVKRF